MQRVNVPEPRKLRGYVDLVAGHHRLCITYVLGKSVAAVTATGYFRALYIHGL